MSAASSSTRDLRLDLFRGLALWFIFIDHIPSNVVSWLTVRNYGFSDATEIFVFISGYTAVIAYSRMMERQGWPMAAAHVARRVWQLYVAHILLFVFFVAQIAWVSIARDTPALIEEMQLMGLGQNPYQALLQTVLLKFRPVNLDVLPLYIVVLASFAFMLPVVVRWPVATVAASLAIYVVVLNRDLNLAAYPDGKVWFFNPFAWQFVFYLGASAAVLGPRLAMLDRFKTFLVTAAIIYLVFAAFIATSWRYNAVAALIPSWVGRILFPIDKTNIDVLRVMHFLAIAYLVRLMVPASARFLRWRVLEPIRRCGEHSLQIFCLGTFLSLSAEIILADYEDSRMAQVIVSISGIVLMCAAAYTASWYKHAPAHRKVA